MENSYWQELLKNSSNILLLQGPVGCFFSQLSTYLEKNHHKKVYKINLNAGDDYFYKANKVAYTGTVDSFYNYLLEFIIKNNIDNVICFGHKRVYHRVAKKICLDRKENTTFWAFEEGYLRPNFITLEKWGVNNDSILSKQADFYLNHDYSDFLKEGQKQVASGFIPRAMAAARYYIAMRVGKKRYPNYQHHRNTSLLYYAKAWCLAGFVLLINKKNDKKIKQDVINKRISPFFIVPLQVHNDSQIKEFNHSRSVPFFIWQVMISFADYADKGSHLIFKHHPMDRGFANYKKIIQDIASSKGIENRVHYVFDINLPIFLRDAKGMVLVNSTSGLSALLHGTPVKVLGLSPYDLPGVTDQKGLNEFWLNPSTPNSKLVKSYRGYLRFKTQLNANFYINNKKEDLIFGRIEH